MEMVSGTTKTALVDKLQCIWIQWCVDVIGGARMERSYYAWGLWRWRQWNCNDCDSGGSAS